MRGILTGQTVEVLLTPEVAQLIQRDLAKIRRATAIEGVLTQAWASVGNGEDSEPIVPAMMTQMSPISPTTPSTELVELATVAILARAASSRVVLFTREQPCPLSAAASALLRFFGVAVDEVPLAQVAACSS